MNDLSKGKVQSIAVGILIAIGFAVFSANAVFNADFAKTRELRHAYYNGQITREQARNALGEQVDRWPMRSAVRSPSVLLSTPSRRRAWRWTQCTRLAWCTAIWPWIIFAFGRMARSC